MYRKTAVAGYYYPEGAKELEKLIAPHLSNQVKQEFTLAIVPHGEFVYSGALLTETLSLLKFKNTAIILGTNHTGFGEDIAVWGSGAWQTPFGDIAIDEALAAEIINTTFAKADNIAHIREHSIEAVTSVLKYIKPDIKIVPITISGMPLAKLRSFADDLAPYLDDASLLVSTELDHYENEEVTDRKDFLAIEQMLIVDGKALYETVMSEGITVCGVYPLFAGLLAAKKAGADIGRLIRHLTSGAVLADKSSVVGYAGIIIAKKGVER